MYTTRDGRVLDIDRLHLAIERGYDGKTTAQIVAVAHEVIAGAKDIAVVVPQHSWLTHISGSFHEVFDMMGVAILSRPKEHEIKVCDGESPGCVCTIRFFVNKSEGLLGVNRDIPRYEVS